MENELFPTGDSSVRTKICGIRSEDQARAIIELGADALGFNFWPRSKRYLDPANAGWLRGLAGQTIRVGVFVNADESTIREWLDHDLIDWAQLHGDESPETVHSLLGQGYRVFKAFGVKDDSSLGQINDFPGPILLDAYAPTQYGGSGEAMDWALGSKAVQQHPDRQIILAGGLTPENVSAAIEQVHPAAVDVASGVELEPGLKDLALCERFIREASRPT